METKHIATKAERKRNPYLSADSIIYGKWFKGNAFSMPLKEFQEIKRYETGVQKPTALMTNKKKTKSRYYYKPIGENEFWD